MLADKKLRFQYNKEAIFDVSFTEKKISYLAIGKIAKGTSATNEYKIYNVEANIYFLQWVDSATKDFLSMLIDLNTMKVYSSVRTSTQGDIFLKGNITKLNK